MCIAGCWASGICIDFSGPTRRVRFTRANIRENKGPSVNKLQVTSSHKRSPYAVLFEDRSQEETERQERYARGDAWRLAKNIYKLQEKEKTAFFSPTDEWILPAASTVKPKEREFVVGSGAGMHMISKKELNSAELETLTISRSPMTVITANGEMLTKRRGNSVCQRIGLIRDSSAS